MHEHGLKRTEPRDEAVGSWVAPVNAAANAALPPHAKHPWTIGANVPGKRRVFMPHVGGIARYRSVTRAYH